MEEETKMFLLCDEYYQQYGGDNYSEVILFKKPYKWADIKKVCEDAQKEYNENSETYDISLYDVIWDRLEKNFEIEDSIAIGSTPYYFEW